MQPNGDAVPGVAAVAALKEIRFLNTNRPTVGAAHNLPIAFSDAVAPASRSASAVWVGEQGKIVLLNVMTGKLLRTITLPDSKGEFSVSVSGSTLYAVANSVGTFPIEIYAISLTSDKIVGSRAIPGPGGYVVAVPGGVWISYRTGMEGSAELLSYPGLTVRSPAPHHVSSQLPHPGTSQGMGIEVTVTGATTWLVDYSAIVCADSRTGRVLGDHSTGNSQGELGLIRAVGHHLYAETNGAKGSTIVEVDAPLACWR